MSNIIAARSNKIKSTLGRKIFVFCNTLTLLAICVVTLFPFLHLLAVSFSSKGAVQRGEVSIIPIGFTLDVYKMIMENGALFTAYGNTLMVVISGTVVNLILTSFAAYVISKDYLPGRKLFTAMIVFTMWFSGGMIPTFLVVQATGIYDSLAALVIPTAISAYHVIIMRTFFKQIPLEIEESAMIDGCNEAVTMFKIILPLSKPVIATVALWIAVFRWNDFYAPLLYLRSRSLYTLQVVMREIVLANAANSYGMDAGDKLENLGNNVIVDSLKYGVIMFSTLPILMVYPFIQKYFAKGVMLGSVKG